MCASEILKHFYPNSCPLIVVHVSELVFYIELRAKGKVPQPASGEPRHVIHLLWTSEENLRDIRRLGTKQTIISYCTGLYTDNMKKENGFKHRSENMKKNKMSEQHALQQQSVLLVYFMLFSWGDHRDLKA